MEWKSFFKSLLKRKSYDCLKKMYFLLFYVKKYPLRIIRVFLTFLELKHFLQKTTITQPKNSLCCEKTPNNFVHALHEECQSNLRFLKKVALLLIFLCVKMFVNMHFALWCRRRCVSIKFNCRMYSAWVFRSWFSIINRLQNRRKFSTRRNLIHIGWVELAEH